MSGYVGYHCNRIAQKNLSFFETKSNNHVGYVQKHVHPFSAPTIRQSMTPLALAE